jgi:L-rhamnose mutarotase
MTERVCFLLRVRPEKLAEYLLAHENVWPDMLDALSRAGWHNYSLFHTEDGLVVGYLETEDFETAVTAMDAEEVNTRWQAAMAPFFTTGHSGPTRLAEYFHLA